MDLPKDLPDVDGFVAVEDCSRIGDIVYVRFEGGLWESFLIADCSGSRETSRWMDRNGIGFEVDYATAVRWDTVGYGADVEILVGQRIGYACD